MSPDFDIAMVGSGFGGSLLAMIARRLGHSVILLERGKHPRFAIGESSTPLANLLLEELASRYDLPRLLPLAKWGTWQKAYPEIGCGLKRGFTFHHHTFGKHWASQPERANELLVAASPHDGVADTHWYRPDFDSFLVREAQALGVEYLDQVNLKRARISSDGIGLEGERNGTEFSLRARFVVDASGPGGFLHRALNLKECAFQYLPPTQALYSHFTGVQRWEKICPSPEIPPYPVDEAAMHQVFKGGWIWVLRFNNGITSAGVAAKAELGNALGLAEGAPAWQRLLQQLPAAQEQFADAKPVFPFIHTPRLSFRSGMVAGQRWALLPSAAGFVDPLLSTGFPLALSGVARLAEIIEHAWNGAQFEQRLRVYESQTLKELDMAERLVAALYANMEHAALFNSLSLLYFAAASFTETARRLGRTELAGSSFLLEDHPHFGPLAKGVLEAALNCPGESERADLIERIYAVIEPIDVAGLSQRTRRNWHGVHREDVLRSSRKLGVSEEQIELMLVRCRFDQPSPSGPLE